MKEFVAIDFETANPKRVSACAIGISVVQNGKIAECNGTLVKPVGGHAAFQSKIHGITAEYTADKPEFDAIYPELKHFFDIPLVGHSLFDKQVLNALSDHFDLKIKFDYEDSAKVAKEKLPHLNNHKLATLAKHFSLPKFKHHDAAEDARACAQIFIYLNELDEIPIGEIAPDDEFVALATEILADNVIDYKEAYQLKYWLEDNKDSAPDFRPMLNIINQTLEDDTLDQIEADAIKALLKMAVQRRIA